jgi:hypothetical protein
MLYRQLSTYRSLFWYNSGSIDTFGILQAQQTIGAAGHVLKPLKAQEENDDWRDGQYDSPPFAEGKDPYVSDNETHHTQQDAELRSQPLGMHLPHLTYRVALAVVIMAARQIQSLA